MIDVVSRFAGYFAVIRRSVGPAKRSLSRRWGSRFWRAQGTTRFLRRVGRRLTADGRVRRRARHRCARRPARGCLLRRHRRQGAGPVTCQAGAGSPLPCEADRQIPPTGGASAHRPVPTVWVSLAVCGTSCDSWSRATPRGFVLLCPSGSRQLRGQSADYAGDAAGRLPRRPDRRSTGQLRPSGFQYHRWSHPDQGRTLVRPKAPGVALVWLATLSSVLKLAKSPWQALVRKACQRCFVRWAASSFSLPSG